MKPVSRDNFLPEGSYDAVFLLSIYWSPHNRLLHVVIFTCSSRLASHWIKPPPAMAAFWSYIWSIGKCRRIMTAMPATIQYNTETKVCLNTCFFQILMNQYCDSWNSSVASIGIALIQVKFSNIHNFKVFVFFSLIPEKMGGKLQNKWWFFWMQLYQNNRVF